MQLQGKIVGFLGDSITEGVGVSCPEARYDQLIGKQYGLAKVCNYGICGTRLAHQRKVTDPPRFDLSFCGRAYDLCPDMDALVVYGGTNDYGHGDAPFGTMEDKTPATYCGAVDFLMELLKTLYPGTKLLFLTPAHRLGDREASCDPTKGPDAGARPLAAYGAVIEQKGAEKGIAVLNLFDALGIDPNEPADMAAYVPDGLHFNDAGHLRLAQCVAEALKKL